MSEVWPAVPYLIVLALAVKYVICGDGTLLARSQVPSFNASNSWPELGSKSKPTWSNQWTGSQQTTVAPLPSNNAWNRRLQFGYQPSPLGPSTSVNTGNTGYVRSQVDKFETLSGNREATDEELRLFSENLLQKDVNNPAKYVTARYQGKTSSRSSRDEAPDPLLQIDTPVYSIDTIQKLVALHDNYIPDTTKAEDHTQQERAEENAFLNAVMATPVMETVRNYLIQKGKLSNNENDFKNLLQQIWFDMYSRGTRKVSSSGFEHVFVAEVKNSQVSGLHNWLYFKAEEDKRNADYLGYMKVLSFGEKGSVMKFHFKYRGIDKPVGSMFIGTSPELEMALYTTCFVIRPDTICPIQMAGNRFIIRTFTYRYRGRNMIGSAFPEI